MNNKVISEHTRAEEVLLHELSKRYEMLASLTGAESAVYINFSPDHDQLPALNRDLVSHRLKVFFGLDK